MHVHVGRRDLHRGAGAIHRHGALIPFPSPSRHNFPCPLDRRFRPQLTIHQQPHHGFRFHPLEYLAFDRGNMAATTARRPLDRAKVLVSSHPPDDLVEPCRLLRGHEE